MFEFNGISTPFKNKEGHEYVKVIGAHETQERTVILQYADSIDIVPIPREKAGLFTSIFYAKQILFNASTSSWEFNK